MTIRQAVKKQFLDDCTKIPKAVTNQNGLKLLFDPSRGCYVGNEQIKDGAGKVVKTKEWIEAVQHTRVPIFWIYCPNIIEEEDKVSRPCMTPHIVPIFEDGDTKICSVCKKEFKATITNTESLACHQLLEDIRKEIDE